MKITESVLISLGFQPNVKGDVFFYNKDEENGLHPIYPKIQLVVKHLNGEQWELNMWDSQYAYNDDIRRIFKTPAYVRDVEEMFQKIADLFVSVGELHKINEIKKALYL
jgi:hypothetical protein